MVEGRRRFIVACIVNPMRLFESLVTEKPSESMELVKSKSVSLAFYRYGVGLVGKYAAIPGSGSAREWEARRSHSATYVRVRYQRWPGPLGGFAARGKIRPAIRTGGGLPLHSRHCSSPSTQSRPPAGRFMAIPRSARSSPTRRSTVPLGQIDVRGEYDHQNGTVSHYELPLM